MQSNKQRWAGRSMTALPVLFLLFDSVIKLIRIDPVVQSFTELGYPVELAIGIGLLELVCLTAYVIPRSSVLGAILLTGYLGGAVATHVRVGSPLFTHVLFPVYVAALLWEGSTCGKTDCARWCRYGPRPLQLTDFAVLNALPITPKSINPGPRTCQADAPFPIRPEARCRSSRPARPALSSAPAQLCRSRSGWGSSPASPSSGRSREH